MVPAMAALATDVPPVRAAGEHQWTEHASDAIHRPPRGCRKCAPTSGVKLGDVHIQNLDVIHKAEGEKNCDAKQGKWSVEKGK